jgi:hypothetical protein
MPPPSACGNCMPTTSSRPISTMDVKVLVIRGEGDSFGGGGDLPEQAEMLSESDDDVFPAARVSASTTPMSATPPKRFLSLPARADRPLRQGAGGQTGRCRNSRKISIIEAKGYCYGWHFYQAGDADLVISSDEALFGHPAFPLRRLGSAAVDLGGDHGLAQVLGNAVHRSALHGPGNGRLQFRQQRRAPGSTGGGNREVRTGLLSFPAHRHGAGTEDFPGNSISSITASTWAAC